MRKYLDYGINVQIDLEYKVQGKLHFTWKHGKQPLKRRGKNFSHWRQVLCTSSFIHRQQPLVWQTNTCMLKEGKQRPDHLLCKHGLTRGLEPNNRSVLEGLKGRTDTPPKGRRRSKRKCKHTWKCSAEVFPCRKRKEAVMGKMSDGGCWAKAIWDKREGPKPQMIISQNRHSVTWKMGKDFFLHNLALNTPEKLFLHFYMYMYIFFFIMICNCAGLRCCG